MKYKITLTLCLLLNASLAYSQVSTDNKSILTGLYLSGGATSSTVSGYDSDYGDIERLIGVRMGLEAGFGNLFAGATFTQRGFQSSFTGNEYYSEDLWQLNYTTGYVYNLFPVSEDLGFLVGAEAGFLNNCKQILKECSTGDCSEDEFNNTTDYSKDEWEDLAGESFDYGLLIGGKYYLNEKLAIIGFYYLGLAEIDNDSWSYDSGLISFSGWYGLLKNRSIQLQIAYSIL